MQNRLLVLDDEVLIAWNTTDEMEDRGWTIDHIVGTSKDALDILTRGEVDAAVLDFNLRADTSEAVARRCIALGIPFVIVSGSLKEELPSFPIEPVLLSKPIDYDRLDGCLKAMLQEKTRTFAAA